MPVDPIDGEARRPVLTLDAAVHDLLERTEQACLKIAHIVKDTGITMKIKDVVDEVERGLPVHRYPPMSGDQRRSLISEMARDIITGDAYED